MLVRVQATKKDAEAALNNFGLYVSSAVAPLFKDVPNKPAYDQYLGEVARVASVYAFQNKKIDLAHKYVDIALQDTAKETHKEAINLKSYLLTQGLTSKADTLKAINALKQLYVEEHGSDQIFGCLTTLYSNMKDKEELNKLINEKLQQDPKNFNALAMKAQGLMNESKWDEAIKVYKEAVAVNGKDALILTYLGFCINAKAASINNNVPEQKKIVYRINGIFGDSS